MILFILIIRLSGNYAKTQLIIYQILGFALFILFIIIDNLIINVNKTIKVKN